MFAQIYKIDTLAAVMLTLISFITIIILKFSKNYMAGSSAYKSFFAKIIMVAVCVASMVSSNNLIVFLVSWFLSNHIIAQLITHKKAWNSAVMSGNFARYSNIMSSVILTIGFFCLYKAGDNILFIDQILGATDIAQDWLITGLICLIFAGMMQSALFPFHHWLLNSPNAPTPVSALMHAGIINAGGFLIIRFSPLFVQFPILLKILFIIGIASGLMGTAFKLIQSDYKNMLTCSTMAQMGFMMAQCGLGFFTAALAHICWHGLFKSYLFLSVGSVAREKRLTIKPSNHLSMLLLSLVCSVLGGYVFSLTSNRTWGVFDTNFILIALAMIASLQLAMALMGARGVKRFPIAFLISVGGAALYGTNVGFIDSLFINEPDMPQTLDFIYLSGLSLLVFAWTITSFMMFFKQSGSKSNFIKRLYVRLLNASQPHDFVVTAHHNHYNFK